MSQTKLILVGGFLGSGKTTLLHRSARILKERGKAVGLITNDQAEGLVDTTFLQMDGNVVREVSGSCFCCNFYGFADAVASVAEEIGGGITIAESVGSCTDLSATIMQPLKEKYRETVVTAPLSVVADPVRLRSVLDHRRRSRAYIIRKQMEEADVILINKIDLLTQAEIADLVSQTVQAFPNARILTISASTGGGVDTWLDLVLSEDIGGSHLADVDYDLYADGEAAYGWLNASYHYAACGNVETIRDKASGFLKGLEEAFADREITVGHVKFLLTARGRRYSGNLTGGKDRPAVTEEICGEAVETDDANILTVNARAETDPKTLQDLVLNIIDRSFEGWTCVGTEIRTLIPGRPSPTFRYDRIADRI